MAFSELTPALAIIMLCWSFLYLVTLALWFVVPNDHKVLKGQLRGARAQEGRKRDNNTASSQCRNR